MSDQVAAAPAAGAPAPAEGAPKDKAPADAPPPKDATPAEKKLWKLKAAGKEVEIDPADEERVKKLLEKGLGANELFEQGASMRKQAEQFMAMLRDPKTARQVLTDPRIGLDLKKFAEDFVWEQIQEQQLTPEQKKQRDRDRELDKYKENEKKAKEEAATKEQTELRQRYAQDYDKRMTAALQTANLPKTPATVARMASYMLQAVKAGYEVDPADLVERVRQDYLEDVKSLFAQTDGDVLSQLLGDELGKKLRDADLKKLKSTTDQAFKTPPPKPGKGAEKPKKLNAQDWLKDVKSGFLGKP